MRTQSTSRGLGRDRLLAAAFVVLVSTAIVGFSAADTGASFTSSTTNPGESWNTATVQPPTAVTATSAVAGKVTLTWTASTSTVTGTQVLTYDIYRGPVGGPYATLVGSTTTSTLTINDTPSSDGSYGYVVQTRIAISGNGFTAATAAVTGKSDRTAPTMSITCNGAACSAGWYTAAVIVAVSGTDGAGVGMGSVTTKIDAAAPVTTAGSSASISVSGDSTGHTVVYSGQDAVTNASANASQTIEIDATPPPAASLSSVIGTVANGDVKLSWSQAADPTSGVASFDTYKKAVATSGTACGTTGFTLVSSGLASGTTTATINVGHNSWACFYVVTHDAAGNVTQSNVSGPTQGK